MSENAIAAAESPDNNVSKAASSVEKPEVNKQLTGSASDSDQENIKKDPGSIKEEDNVDESTKQIRFHEKNLIFPKNSKITIENQGSNEQYIEKLCEIKL